MAGPTEFSVEAVRQFMLAHEGKVTNHDLVKHFRTWLSHPTERDSARQRLKEYVNTLATIKQQDGEKFLVLKKKYYPDFGPDDDAERLRTGSASAEPSLLDEVMANYQPPSSTLSSGSFLRQSPSVAPPPRRQLPATPSPQPTAALRVPPPYRGPPPQFNKPLPVMNPSPYRPASIPSRPLPMVLPASDLGLPLPADYGLPTHRQSAAVAPFHAPTSFASPAHGLPPPFPGALPPPREDASIHHHVQPPSLPLSPPPPLLPRNSGSSSSSLSRSSSNMSMSQAYPPPIPARNSLAGSTSSIGSSSGNGHHVASRQTSQEDKENAPNPVANEESAALSSSCSELPVQGCVKSNEKISVKERTKTFNRLASEVELTSSKGGSHLSAPVAVKRRNSRATEKRASSMVREEDSSSICTMDPTAKQWMVKAAQGDYHAMVKMLRDDPRLAKHRDFTSGYTALHWAAKKGHLDTIKLLAGNYSVPVNVKSHGGYTPLHLACMFDHQEVFSLMVKAYGADPHLRDNAGKKPRQYMMAADQTSSTLSLSSDTFRQLKDRRRNRTRQHHDKNSGILRFGSLSVKVKKTTEAFNSYFGARSTISDNLSLPYLPNSNSTPNINEEDEDSSKMPPPRFAPVKKRRSKRPSDFTRHVIKSAPPATSSADKVQKEHASDSDSEYGFNSQNWVMK